jgi:parvulin-like peptidyl-prolyl isomerase
VGIQRQDRTVVRGLFFVLGGLAFWAVAPACRKSEFSGPVVAQVGDTKITMEELKARLQEAPAAYQQYVASAEGRRQFLNLLIREKILLAQAKAMGIPRDPTYKEAIAKFKEGWARRLKEYQETLQIESALRRLRSKDLAVSDTEVENYYNEHSNEYQKPVEIMVSHILLSTPEDAETALARLKSGESFESVARAMSKDPATAVHGGKLSPMQRGNFVPEFEDAAFALKVGQTSGVVKTQFGFHIIRKLGERRLPPKSLADAKEDIRSVLERDKFNQWVTAKQSALGVQINDQALSQLSVEETPKQ